MNGLMVLREINNRFPDLHKNLDHDKNLIELQDGTTLVDNDHAWDAEIAQLIGQSTVGFRLVDQDFNTLYTNRDLAKVEKARSGAKVTLAVDVDLDDDEADAAADAE